MGEVIILKVVDDYTTTVSYSAAVSSSWCFCRICHEGDSLEAPCACSGSLKFAHRDCVQRWCNEKGNTICEICLQKFEPGYTALPKKAVLITSSAASRGRGEYEIIQRAESERESPSYSPGCLAAVDRSVTCCKYVALLLTVVLLLRHLLPLLAEGTTPHYPFALPTLLILRAIGILFPMYILVRIITAFHNTVRHLRDLEAQLSIGIHEDQHLPIV